MALICTVNVAGNMNRLVTITARICPVSTANPPMTPDKSSSPITRSMEPSIFSSQLNRSQQIAAALRPRSGPGSGLLVGIGAYHDVTSRLTKIKTRARKASSSSTQNNRLEPFRQMNMHLYTWHTPAIRLSCPENTTTAKGSPSYRYDEF